MVVTVVRVDRRRPKVEEIEREKKSGCEGEEMELTRVVLHRTSPTCPEELT